MIIRIDKYTNEDGKLIEENVTVDNTNPKKDIPRFMGTAILQIDTPAGPHQQPLKFKIDATDINDAFAKFSKYANLAMQKLQERAEKEAREQQSKIQIAGQMPNLPTPGKKLIL